MSSILSGVDYLTPFVLNGRVFGGLRVLVGPRQMGRGLRMWFGVYINKRVGRFWGYNNKIGSVWLFIYTRTNFAILTKPRG